MPHRPIDSRWRANDRFRGGLTIRPGDILRVTENVGVDSNRVFNETLNTMIRNPRVIGSDYYTRVEDAAPAAPVEAAPPPAPPVVEFTPNEDEQYFIIWRRHDNMRAGRSIYSMSRQNSEATMTLQNARNYIRDNLNSGYEYFLVPARAVERHSDRGVMDTEFGTRIVE